MLIAQYRQSTTFLSVVTTVIGRSGRWPGAIRRAGPIRSEFARTSRRDHAIDPASEAGSLLLFSTAFSGGETP